ncbi:MAG: 50S ribosomal protein L15 [Chloroflexi bacterium]|nr:50S ribosomal protein L15 [Chloroflexota bacterium]
MKQNELRPPPGAMHSRKRVGRGLGSGHGTTAGRGTKGQKARTGGNVSPHFEGGQLPIVRRLPYKRGFTSIFKTNYFVVNLRDLKDLEPNSEITPQRLVEMGKIKSLKNPVKVLGDGEITVPLRIQAHKFSAKAKEKISAVGGEAVEVV